MIKLVSLTFIMFYSASLLAEKPHGFLWYDIEKEPQKSNRKAHSLAFKNLSFTDQDAVLRFYTMEALHKARNTKKLEDMRVFLSLQDYWLNESSHFKELFQKTMLLYPEYDYTVSHPTSNLGIKITDEGRQARQINTISRLAKTHGILFFYRGNSPYDLKQIPIIDNFCKRFHLTLMPITVDGVSSAHWTHSQIDKGQAQQLGVHYFPAILLVNPKIQRVIPLAYGLTTQDVLMERVTAVYKGEML